MQKIVKSETLDLKKSLPYGAIKEVAKRSNSSIYTVSRVIKGGSKNQAVLKALAEYVEELANTKQQLKKALEFNNC